MSEETKHPNTPNVMTEQDKGRCAPATGSASIVRRDLEEIRIECDVNDQDWIKTEMERLTSDRWEVIHFGSPKISPMQYSTRLVLIAVRSKPNARAEARRENPKA